MLYMVFDKKANINLVKVGKAKKVETRKSGYLTHNPLAEIRWESQGMAEEESRARSQIMNRGGKRAVKRSEWLVVDDELYNELYERGFNALKGFSGKKPRRFKKGG